MLDPCDELPSGIHVLVQPGLLLAADLLQWGLALERGAFHLDQPHLSVQSGLSKQLLSVVRQRLLGIFFPELPELVAI